MNWVDILPYVLPWLAVPALACTVAWVALWWFMSQHARWFEETELFLDTIEVGISDGLGFGPALAGMATVHGRAVSPAWHGVVADLQAGRRLGEALDRAPGLLPAPIAGLVKAGEATGEWRAVLLGARRWLKRPLGRAAPWTQGALEMQYYSVSSEDYEARDRVSPWSQGVMFNAVALTVLGGGVAWLLGASVFGAIADGMRGLDMEPPLTLRWMQDWFPAFIAGQGIYALTVVVLALTCLGGPQLGLWLEKLAPAKVRAALQALPWRRKRALRDFSVMFAALLDAGVPEEAALRQAAAWSDGGALLRTRAEAAMAELRAGVWLPEALRHLDSDAELQWRTSLAVTRAGGFGEALRGWQESLEANAQQQEAIAGGVLMIWGELGNAFIVGALAFIVFRVLVVVTDMNWLW